MGPSLARLVAINDLERGAALTALYNNAVVHNPAVFEDKPLLSPAEAAQVLKQGDGAVIPQINGLRLDLKFRGWLDNGRAITPPDFYFVLSEALYDLERDARYRNLDSPALPTRPHKACAELAAQLPALIRAVCRPEFGREVLGILERAEFFLR